jgi:hypothetical protein
MQSLTKKHFCCAGPATEFHTEVAQKRRYFRIDNPTGTHQIYLYVGGTRKGILLRGFKLSKSGFADNLAQLGPSSPVQFSPCEVGQ